jgi:hypothetical protein
MIFTSFLGSVEGKLEDLQLFKTGYQCGRNEKEVERGRGQKKGSWKKRGQPKEEIKVVK